MCPTCGTESEADSRFCPKCGGSLDSKLQDIQVEFQIPKSGIAIEFAQSTAAASLKLWILLKRHKVIRTVRKVKRYGILPFILRV